MRTCCRAKMSTNVTYHALGFEMRQSVTRLRTLEHLNFFSVLKSLEFYKQSTRNHTIVTRKIAIPLLQSRSDCCHTPPIAIGCNRRLQSKPPAGAPPAQGRPLRKSALRVGDKQRRRQKNFTLRCISCSKQQVRKRKEAEGYVLVV